MAIPAYTKTMTYTPLYEGGTKQNMGPSDFTNQGAQKLEAAKKKCIAKGAGWYWDEKKGVCVRGAAPMPKWDSSVKPEGAGQTTQNTTPTPKIWGNSIPGKYDEERGGYLTDSGAFYKTSDKEYKPTYAYSGVDFNKDGTVSVRKGDNIINLTREEYDNYHKLEMGKGGLETGKAKELMALPKEEEARAQQMQARVKQLMDMASQGLLTSEELQAIQGANADYGQAAGAGLSSVIPGLVGGAAAGAAGGALLGGVGAVPGALIGGAAGAIGTFLNGMRSSIKSQQAGEFSADQSALSKGQTMLRSLITDTNQNPQHAVENIALFYQTLNLIDSAHARTYRDSQENLNQFLGNDGTEQLAKFEVFDTTMRQYYVMRFEAALMQPNPSLSLITEEDLQEQ